MDLAAIGQHVVITFDVKDIDFSDYDDDNCEWIGKVTENFVISNL